MTAEPLPPVLRGAPDDPRYLRQVLLFGAAGQAKLCSAAVELDAEGLAGAVAERYGLGAGLSVARGAHGHPRADVVSDPAAAEVLAGARGVLVKMLEVLGQ